MPFNDFAPSIANFTAYIYVRESTAATQDQDSAYIMWSFYISCVMLILALFGIVCNSICAVIFMSPKMRSPINIILTGLCGIDNTVVILAIPLLVLYGLNTYLMSTTIDHIISYSIATLYPLAMSAKTCSVWAFVLITFERYMAVCHPLKARSLFYSNRRACFAIFGLVVCSILYNFIRFWEYRLQYNNFGDPVPTFLLRENEIYYKVYYTGLFLLTHFLVPFTILLVLNTHIIRTISAAKKQRERLSRQEMREYKTAHMLVVVIVVFALTNTLPFIMNIIEAVNTKFIDDPETKLTAALILDISNTLVILNSSTTIFIYYYFSSKFRTIFRKKYLRCGRTADVPNFYFGATNYSTVSLHEIEAGPTSAILNYLRQLSIMIVNSARPAPPPSRQRSFNDFLYTLPPTFDDLNLSNQQRRIAHHPGSVKDHLSSGATYSTENSSTSCLGTNNLNMRRHVSCPEAVTEQLMLMRHLSPNSSKQQLKQASTRTNLYRSPPAPETFQQRRRSRNTEVKHFVETNGNAVVLQLS